MEHWGRTNPRNKNVKWLRKTFILFQHSIWRTLSLPLSLSESFSVCVYGWQDSGESCPCVCLCNDELHFACLQLPQSQVKRQFPEPGSSARFYEYLRPSATHLLFYENGKMRRQMLPGVALAGRMRLQWLPQHKEPQIYKPFRGSSCVCPCVCGLSYAPVCGN